MQGLFDELVTNSDSANAQMAASSAGAAQRRLRIRRRGSAAASNQERASHARAGPNVSEQRGSPTYAPESEQAPHVPSHWEDEAEANVEEEAEEEVEEEDEDDDEEEEEDEDEGSPSNLSSGMCWYILRPRSTDPMFRKCLVVLHAGMHHVEIHFQQTDASVRAAASVPKRPCTKQSCQK